VDVETGRYPVRRHIGERQREIACRLRVLPLAGVDVTGHHFVGRVARVAPADDRDFAWLDGDLVEDALDRAVTPSPRPMIALIFLRLAVR
jgi:hypothetical protein